jgi:hypothetical protein
MSTSRVPGAYHESPRPLYIRWLFRDNGPGRDRLDLCGRRPSAPHTQAGPALGSDFRGDEASVERGGQTRRRPTGAVLGCLVVYAVGRLDAGQKFPRAPDGSVCGRECRRPGLHREARRADPADSGSCQQRPGVCRPGQRRGGRGQHPDPQRRQAVWMCRSRPAVRGDHGPGTPHRVSQRTWDLAGAGPTVCQSPGEPGDAPGFRG